MSSQPSLTPSFPDHTLRVAAPPTRLSASAQRSDYQEAFKRRQEARFGLQAQIARNAYPSNRDENNESKNRRLAGEEDFRKRMQAASRTAAEVSKMSTDEWFETDKKTEGIEGHFGDFKIKEEALEFLSEDDTSVDGRVKIGGQAKEAAKGAGAERYSGLADPPKDEHKALFAALGIDGKKFRKAPRRLKAEDCWAI